MMPESCHTNPSRQAWSRLWYCVNQKSICSEKYMYKCYSMGNSLICLICLVYLIYPILSDLPDLSDLSDRSDVSYLSDRSDVCKAPKHVQDKRGSERTPKHRQWKLPRSAKQLGGVTYMSKTPKITRERTSELALAPHSSAGTLVKNHAKLQELWQETNCLLASCEQQRAVCSSLPAPSRAVSTWNCRARHRTNNVHSGQIIDPHVITWWSRSFRVDTFLICMMYGIYH